MMLNDYLMLAAVMRGGRGECAPAIVCDDGLVLSVQASRSHYCAPRDNQGPWWAVEVCVIDGNVTRRDEALLGLGLTERDQGDPHGYVPVSNVEAIIVFHGGIDMDTTCSRFRCLSRRTQSKGEED